MTAGVLLFRYARAGASSIAKPFSPGDASHTT